MPEVGRSIGGPEHPHPGKSQKAIGFFRNIGTEPPREQIASLGRFVRPSVKYVDDLKNVDMTRRSPPDGILWR